MAEYEAYGQVLNCRRCKLHTGQVSPVPMVMPHRNAHIAVVGESPGYHENRQLIPFVGPAGQLLRGWLREVGINPLDCGYLNVVSCMTGKPTPEEVTACAPNVTLQLSALDPAYVLVLGQTALDCLCPVRSLTIGKMRGRCWRINSAEKSVWAMATYHPAAVLRNRELGDQTLEDIYLFGHLVKGDVEPHPGFLCARCHKREAVVTVECGLPLCGRCRRFARPVLEQGELFAEELVPDPRRWSR